MTYGCPYSLPQINITQDDYKGLVSLSLSRKGSHHVTLFQWNQLPISGLPVFFSKKIKINLIIYSVIMCRNILWLLKYLKQNIVCIKILIIISSLNHVQYHTPLCNSTYFLFNSIVFLFFINLPLLIHV